MTPAQRLQVALAGISDRDTLRFLAVLAALRGPAAAAVEAELVTMRDRLTKARAAHDDAKARGAQSAADRHAKRVRLTAQRVAELEAERAMMETT